MPDAKEVLKAVFTPAGFKVIWAANYPDLIPFTLQDFEIGSVLPAMMYMFRRGHRRGSGQFRTTFAPRDTEVIQKRIRPGTRPEPSVASVARVLAADGRWFSGFDTPLGQQVLSDCLLCQCLENQRHEAGRNLPLIRAFPTHYMASWIDLPKTISYLRDVPECLIAILADQKSGEVINADMCERSWFRIGSDFERNLLLRVLGKGMSLGHGPNDLNESFDESVAVGVDQLLTVRMAQQCEAAPQRLQGGGGSEIPNRHPVAKQASRVLNEDFRILLQAYGAGVPRQCLLPMLESCLCLGLTNLLLSSSLMMSDWEETGTLPTTASPWPLFVDASSSIDRDLRSISEDVMDDMYRRLKRLPVILMALRIAGNKAEDDRRLSAELPPSRPDATARINFLGELLQQRHPLSERLHDDVWEKANKCLKGLRGLPDCHDAVAILENEVAIPNSVWRMAEAVSQLMGDKNQFKHLTDCLVSVLLVGEAQGLAAERRVQFKTVRNGKKTGVVRSIVLTNTMLDFLVHRHLRELGSNGATQQHSLSFTRLLTILRERYGLYVDQAPPGQLISMELLLRNRDILEERLRALGLLVGVNDAQSMKRLRPRFKAREVQDAGGE